MLRRDSAQATRRQRLSENPDPTAPSGNFSYSSGRHKQAEAAPPSEKLGHFWLQRIGLLVFLVAATASAVNILSLAPSARVLPLSTSDSQSFLRPTATYETAADQLLKSSVWNHTKVTVDAAGISQQLLQQFPELSSVSLTVPLLAHRPLIYVQPSQPALVLNASDGAYVLDTTGKALIKLGGATQVSKSLPSLTDQSGLRVQLNHQALPADSVKFIQIILAELSAKQYTASSLVLPPASSEVDVHLAGQPFFVKFNLESSDPRGEAGAFLATITNLKKQNITPAQYVDVRVDGRAYYQ